LYDIAKFTALESSKSHWLKRNNFFD
jgi:hypothetical protein